MERDADIPSGKGCFWTILPGYEQQFIDNLVKRGMGSAGSSTTKKHADSLSSTSTSKQFRKFIDASVNKSNSPLFTIFRMNPTTTPSPSNKRKKTAHEKKMEVKHEEPDLQYDSDCDSGVDLSCEMYPKKSQRPASMHIQPTAKLASRPLAPPPPPSPANQTAHQSYNSLLMENSMFIPDDLFITQQSNVSMSTTSDDTSHYFDNISTPSSIIMDQQLFSNDLGNWPQSAQQTPIFDLQPQSQILSTQPTPQNLSYYNPSTTNFAPLGTSNNNEYLLQQSHQPFQDYYLYNDFC